MEKAGGIEEFIEQHRKEIAKNNTERRIKYLKFKQDAEAKAKEAKQKDKSTRAPSTSI